MHSLSCLLVRISLWQLIPYHEKPSLGPIRIIASLVFFDRFAIVWNSKAIIPFASICWKVTFWISVGFFLMHSCVTFTLSKSWYGLSFVKVNEGATLAVKTGFHWWFSFHKPFMLRRVSFTSSISFVVFRNFISLTSNCAWHNFLSFTKFPSI